MATIKSIFGAYADQLQVMVNNSLDAFAPTFFQNYFDMGVPSLSLTYVSAIGRSRIEAAASVVDRDAASPIRSRAGLDKLSGEIPAIKEKFKMSESDYRNYLTLQAMNINPAQKKQAMLDLLFGDTKRVGDAAMKRVDMMVLEGLSTGFVTLTTTNNPDGVVTSQSIDLLMAAANKKTSTVTWNAADKTTTKPITDIKAVVIAGRAAGKRFNKMLMTDAAFQNFIQSKEVIDSLAGFFRIALGTVTATLDTINQYLTANRWPIIEIVDLNYIGVEKDGKIGVVNPFSDDNVAFIPAGKLGVIHNAYAIEQQQPVGNVSYATFNNALISKWQENEPFAEYTKVEFNAFPGFEAIDDTYLLNINH